MSFPLADAMKQCDYYGHTVDQITLAILIAAEAKLGYKPTMLQGGFRPKTSYSGTTHTKGGVGDLTPDDADNKIRVFSSLGCYPYHRAYWPGVWEEHVHFGVIDHPYRDSELAQQQDDWLAHPPLDGLADHAALTGQYWPGKKIVFNYDPTTHKEVVPMTKIEQARAELLTGIHNVGQAQALLDDTDPSRVVAHAQIAKLKESKKDLRAILNTLPAK